MIPGELDAMEPGPVLGALLASIAVDKLSGYDRVVVMKAYQRMASHYQAGVYQGMAAISELMSQEDLEADLAWDAAASEIRAALRLTRRAAESDLGLAVDLVQRLPRVWEALAKGLIDLRKARTIVYGTCHLTDDSAREVVERVIDRAARLTTGQLAAVLRKMCIEVDPEEAANRFENAVVERRLIAEATMEGTANLLGLDLPPDRVAAIQARISDIAQHLKAGDETRTMDQLRADIFLDLLEGHAFQNKGGKAAVNLTVDLETLAGLSEAPGELAGFGPVIADIARQVTEQHQRSQWRWTVTHPATGLPVHQGITSRRPNAAQRREVEAYNPTCVFPGCRMPAVSCDLDHRIPWAKGGKTRSDNLVPLCRHDHVIRHQVGWKHRALPNGDHQWVSPLGHTYTTSGQPP